MAAGSNETSSSAGAGGCCVLQAGAESFSSWKQVAAALESDTATHYTLEVERNHGRMRGYRYGISWPDMVAAAREVSSGFKHQ